MKGSEDPDEGGPEAVPSVDDLLDEFTELEETVDTPEEREQVRETMRVALSVTAASGVFGRVIKGFDSEDQAEAFLGALLFGIPMAVEDGTIEAGAHLADHPSMIVATAAGMIAIVVGILYVADIQDVRVSNPILGVVPRRPVGIVGAALITSLALFTVWGRVSWSIGSVGANLEPAAVCLVAMVPMAIGAALGDILPGS